MRVGKLTNRDLEEIVLSRLPRLSGDTFRGAEVGSDCAFVKIGDHILVTSTDPVTAGGMLSGTLAVHVSCNDIAAAGIKPTSLLLVLLAPPTATREQLITLVDQAAAAADSLGVDIIGGHTEITDSVNRFVITTTAFGNWSPNLPLVSGRAHIGDSLIMTKTAALEGTFIAAHEYEQRARRILSDQEYSDALALIGQLSVVTEGLVAASTPLSDKRKDPNGYMLSAASAMHDVTEGGVYGAAHEMATLSGLGIRIEKSAIPILPVTAKIASAFGLNPYRLIASGSLLIATPEPESILCHLREKEIRGTVIGQFVESGFTIRQENGEDEELTPPEADELYKLS